VSWPDSVSVGSNVSVVGVKGYSADDEPQITATSVTVNGSTSVPSPLAVRPDWLTLADDMINLHNLGMLVRVWGVVTLDTICGDFGINSSICGEDYEGGKTIGVYLAPGMQAPAEGSLVAVTGVSSQVAGFMGSHWPCVRATEEPNILSTSTEQITIYPGENWISFPLIPLNTDPAESYYFGSTPVDGIFWQGSAQATDDLITGNLYSYDAYNGTWATYGVGDFRYFGHMGSAWFGDGYILNNTGSQTTVSFTGIANGVPNASETKTDIWISLPGRYGQQGGVHWIGHPFNHNVPFVNVKVTDGLVTLPVMDAINQGWLQGHWGYLGKSSVLVSICIFSQL
jgi:hypothetical protein